MAKARDGEELKEKDNETENILREIEKVKLNAGAEKRTKREIQ